MFLSKRALRIIAIFTGSFLLCGILHVLLWGIPFFCNFSQLYCASLVLLWGMSVKKRVTDPRLCSLLLWISFFFILYLSFQLLRYSLPFCVLARFLWYAYYIPMTAIPLLCLYLALYIHRLPEEKLHPLWCLPAAAGGLIALGFLTNDLHHLAFRSAGGPLKGNGDELWGPLYYLFLTVFILTMLMYYLIILHKSRQAPARTFHALALLPMLLEFLYLILGIAGLKPAINGILLWNHVEFFSFCTIAFLEICIQIRLIPSNRDYEQLFSITTLPAVIIDHLGDPVFQTGKGHYPFRENENTLILSHPISGGRILWSADIRVLRDLNRQLAEAADRMHSRNDYLMSVNRTKEKNEKLESQNRIYSQIGEIIQPQVRQILRILQNNCGFTSHLPRLILLTTYIKRRSNLELVRTDNRLSSEELALALQELLKNIGICGIHTALTAIGEEQYESGIITTACEQIEAILENTLDSLTDLLIILRAGPRHLNIRIMLRAAASTPLPENAIIKNNGFSLKRSLLHTGPDSLLILTFTEEGDRS